jgi:hypothetical protein
MLSKLLIRCQLIPSVKVAMNPAFAGGACVQVGTEPGGDVIEALRASTAADIVRLSLDVSAGVASAMTLPESRTSDSMLSTSRRPSTSDPARCANRGRARARSAGEGRRETVAL